MNHDCFLDQASELNILGNWFKDRHREDVALLDIQIFNCKNLYKGVLSGKEWTQLMAENKTDGVTLTELISATDPDGLGGGILTESAYQDARANALLCQRQLLIGRLSDPATDIPKATAELLKIQAAIDSREVKPAASDLADNFLKAIEKDNKAGRVKFGRGFEDLDRRTGSMQRGQLVVLAARPGTGKSAAALQIAFSAANRGEKVLFFPLEMTTQETLERLILQRQVVESQTALRALTADEKENIITFLNWLESSGNFLIYEGVNNLETIEQTIKEQAPDLVVIDQLTQVRTARKTKDIRERYAEVTAELKHAAIEYKTAILLLTQLNRAATDQGQPTLENLHESDSTGQNADIVLLMARQTEDDEKRPSSRREKKLEELKIYIVKNRGGESGKTVFVTFNGSIFTFNGTENR